MMISLYVMVLRVEKFTKTVRGMALRSNPLRCRVEIWSQMVYAIGGMSGRPFSENWA
jgi:hypothetical protein